MFRSFFVVFVLAFSSIAHASVILGTTRVIIKSSDKEATVQIRNPDNLPKIIQVWIDDGNKDVSPDVIDVPFQVLPPVFRVNEGKGQALRILPLPNDLPQNQESVFWLNVLEVPPKPDGLGGENYVQFALRNRIKLFYRPAGLDGRASYAGESLKWSLRENQLIAINSTPYHISLSSAELLKGNDKDGASIPVDMVPPFSESVIDAKGLNVSPGNTVKYFYIDDLGAVRKSLGVISRE